LFRRPRSEPQSSTAGFTIIEALVALAVVASSLAAIGALVATSARGVGAIEHHVALVETARAILAALPQRDQLAPGSMSGERAGHRWRVDVAPMAGAAPSEWVPQTVIVSVRSPSGARMTVQTVRLRHEAQR
jgi:general secretion pathway protein I